MLVGLWMLCELAVFADLLIKNKWTAIKAVVFAAATILIGAAFFDPMEPAARFWCASSGTLILGLFVFLVIKTIHWKREAKAAQMLNRSAT